MRKLLSMNRSSVLLLGSALLSALAAVVLVAGLVIRTDGSTGMLFRLHDACAVLAAMCIAAAAWSLKGVATRHGGSAGATIAVVGTTSAVVTALCLGLVLLAHASDMLYMLPQGGIGLWLIAVCAKWPTAIGRATRYLGLGVGVGLLMVAGSFIAIATAQGPALWALRDQHLGPLDPAIESSSLNVVGHQVLALGSLLGVLMYPVWAVMASRALAQERATL